MDHDWIDSRLKHAPSMKLLRSDNAPLVVSFLYEQFKRSHRVAIPFPELVERLEDCLEVLHEGRPDLYRRSAQVYLKTWSDNDHQFLRSYYETGSDDPVFELTPDMEKAIGWLQDLNKSDFVGTESRFLRVFELLEDIVDKSSEDVQTRLAQLEKQKEAIQREIDRIQHTGEIQTYSATQIKERFFEANDVARRLLGDFREVEQNFRELARTVQEEQLKEGARKGAIVAHVLDAEQTLQQSDQGRSFYGFWKFLMSPSKQDQLRRLLNLVYQLPNVQDSRQDGQVLRRIKNSLIEAGGKIMRSNQGLAEQLRRMLDEQNIIEERRVLELINDIKKSAVALADEPPKIDRFIMLEGAPEVRLLMEKRLWEPKEKPNFDHNDINVGQVDLSTVDMGSLYHQFYVDERLLQQQIYELLETRSQVTLAELTQQYPIQKGLSEIIAYFTIAAQNEQHHIDGSAREEIVLSDRNAAPSNQNATKKTVTLPKIVFMASS
ncbi:MAG: DUF3375 domain-containing protein [Ardenticatenaceae bacterium]